MNRVGVWIHLSGDLLKKNAIISKRKTVVSLITVALISQTHLNVNFVHNISSLGYDSIFSLFMSL